MPAGTQVHAGTCPAPVWERYRVEREREREGWGRPGCLLTARPHSCGEVTASCIAGRAMGNCQARSNHWVRRYCNRCVMSFHHQLPEIDIRTASTPSVWVSPTAHGPHKDGPERPIGHSWFRSGILPQQTPPERKSRCLLFAAGGRCTVPRPEAFHIADAVGHSGQVAVDVDHHKAHAVLAPKPSCEPVQAEV